MRGRFAQSQTCKEYLAYLAEEVERDIVYNPEPVGQYSVALGTKVSLLGGRDEQLHLDPVHRGYTSGWWDKLPLINVRVETAANSRIFKLLWQYGRTICFADGWFEWKREGDRKQSYSAHCADGLPIFMVTIGSVPFEHSGETEEFSVVTTAADQGLVDIHDRQPLVLMPEVARERMHKDIGGKEAEEIAVGEAVSAGHFT